MKTIQERLQIMTNRLSDKELFEKNGLGNEINFHIFDYDPEDEYIVRDYLENYLLKKKNLNIASFDIYDIIIDLLKKDGFFNECFDYEKEEGTEDLNELISRIIGIGNDNNLLSKTIKEKIKPNQIIILTGIGKCYNIVRGHTILNNLQSIVTENPLIMFYPGIYDGQSFKLFNKLENDNYYRAFQFVSR